MNTRKQALKYGLSFPDTYQDAPFHDPNWQLVRYKGNDKAFLWTYERNGLINLNVKVDPDKALFWRSMYPAVIPGYHQNKEHWNTIILDGSIPDRDIIQMIRESYNLISDCPSKRIYEAVKKIPSGRVATYADIAELAGDRKMARAVGNALHKNPDPEHIPCHRVVNAKGELAGGFAFGGADVQAKLLEAEGVELQNGVVDLKRFRWSMHHNFLFDLDQTLLDFHASEYKALGIVLRSNGLSFSDAIYQAFKEYNKTLWMELEKGNITRPELFIKRFQYVFSLCEGDSGALDPRKVNDDFIRTMSVNGVLMDGALEFIRKLKRDIPDARIYIASNGATINAKGRMASTGLDQYIEYLFISEDLGVTKPDAAFFEICLDKIAEPRSSCIMIGDSLSSDMLGAKNASIDSVWFMPSGDIEKSMQEYDINYVASSFDELYFVLKKWSGFTGDLSDS